MADNVRIDILASDKTKGATEQTKKNLREIGDEAAVANAKAGAALNQAGAAIEARTAGFRKLQGAISSTIGAVTGLVGAITGIIAVLGLVGRLMNARFEELKRTRQAISDVSQEFFELSHKAQRTLDGRAPNKYGQEFEKIEEHVRELDIQFNKAGVSQKKLVEEIRPALAKYKQDLIDIVQQTRDLDELEAGRAALRESIRKGLSDEAAIEFDSANRVAELRRTQRETENEAARKLIDEAIDREVKAREDALRRLRERERAERNRQITEDTAAYWAEYSRLRDAALRREHEQRMEFLRQAQDFQNLQQRQAFGSSHTGVLAGRTFATKVGGEFTRAIR